MRVLLTGGTGFVGQWLTRALVARGDDVTITGLAGPRHGPDILTAAEWTAVRAMPADITHEEALASVVDASNPDLVVHLAGVSFVPEADRAPTAAYDINVLGAVRLLSILARRRATGTVDPTIIVVGSGNEYGRHDSAEMPLTEAAELRPLNVYAATKAAQEIAALSVHRATGLRVICTRSFNHSGVGQDPNFLLPALVGRVRKLAATSRGTLTLGNNVIRDYLHIDDVVRAYLLLADRGVPGEVYNVCSGVGVSVRQLAADVLLRAGVAADISTDVALVRTADIPVLVGSPDKLAHATGWATTRSHRDIIEDLILSDLA